MVECVGRVRVTVGDYGSCLVSAVGGGDVDRLLDLEVPGAVGGIARATINHLLCQQYSALDCLDGESICREDDRHRDIGVCVGAWVKRGTVVWFCEVNDCGRDVWVGATIGREGYGTHDDIQEL